MEGKEISLSSGGNNITKLSQEEENYVRLGLLLSGVAQRAVHAFFSTEFDPSRLIPSLTKIRTKLKFLEKEGIINPSQYKILFPNEGVPDSSLFDVTLMITLLTNFANIEPCENLPYVKEITESADLGRIKYYRNNISHNRYGTIDSSFFITAWNDVSEAVGRLGGTQMLNECKELRTKILDHSVVPWKLRVQINQKLEEWKTDDYMFLETKAAKHVLKYLQERSCVTITGSNGVGKTATLRHVALQMKNNGYRVLLVTNPQDIFRFYNPNEKTLFVIDDFCGTYSINQSEINSLEPVLECLSVLIQNKVKIIVACRLQVYQDTKFECLTIFKRCVCNLISEDLCLSRKEKQSIAELYLDTKAVEIFQYCNLYNCFPLLCKLQNDNPEHNIEDFFKNPFAVYEVEIDALYVEGHFGKYCALAICLMFNNRLKEEWLTEEVDTEKRAIIENTCEVCRLNRYTSRLVLLDELKSLEYTFIKKDQDEYKTIHDTVFDVLADNFGKKLNEHFIENEDPCNMMQRFLLAKRRPRSNYQCWII